MRDRRRYRSENENVDEKYVVVRKIDKVVVVVSGSRGCRNRAAGLTARRCDVGLALRPRRRRGQQSLSRNNAD